MISKGSKALYPIESFNQAEIAAFYLGISKIPILINSPLRQDNRPSFGLYCPKGTDIRYTDFSTGESGNLWDLLGKLWHCSFREVYDRVQREFKSTDITINTPKHRVICSVSKNIKIKCKVREWRKYDIDYWESYGITLEWLKYADVYPISHKIVIKDGKTYIFGADKLAYAYVEFKENNASIKIYQPLNTKGFKWSNGHDKSVISLWTKIPKHGEKLCICSSLKDALCLTIHTNIPAIAIQGEGYSMSKTAINNLKSRYNKIFICLDNDDVGLKDAIKLAESTGFTNVVLPKFEGGKDISDARKIMGEEKFKEYITPLFK